MNSDIFMTKEVCIPRGVGLSLTPKNFNGVKCWFWKTTHFYTLKIDNHIHIFEVLAQEYEWTDLNKHIIMTRALPIIEVLNFYT